MNSIHSLTHSIGSGPIWSLAAFTSLFHSSLSNAISCQWSGVSTPSCSRSFFNIIFPSHATCAVSLQVVFHPVFQTSLPWQSCSPPFGPHVQPTAAFVLLLCWLLGVILIAVLVHVCVFSAKCLQCCHIKVPIFFLGLHFQILGVFSPILLLTSMFHNHKPG